MVARVAGTPMPLAMECTSAPTFSHRAAISFMKVILVARNALAAYLIISALSSPVKTTGVSSKCRSAAWSVGVEIVMTRSARFDLIAFMRLSIQ